MSLTITSQEQLLRDNVARQLEWDPQFDASRVAVTVKDGIATLSGYVGTYAAKLAAERCARKVYGIQGVANELQVTLAEERIDPDLAHDAVTALKNHVDVPPGVEVTVRDIDLMWNPGDASSLLVGGRPPVPGPSKSRPLGGLLLR